MKKEFVTLFKKTANGGVLEWDIWVDGTESCALIHTRFGLRDGKKQHLTDTVTEGKNLGKKNATTAYGQACAEAEATWTKQLERKGYGRDVAASAAVRETSPMLALDIADKEGDIDWANAFAQPKLDGFRCLATRVGNTVSMVSRGHKPIVTMKHIAAELKPMLKEGVTLDGELYCHGMEFQKISSAIKRLSDLSRQISYHIYDAVMPVSYDERYNFIDELFNVPRKTLVLVETVVVGDRDDLNKCQQRFVGQGYEGAMLRHGNAGYEPGKRSKTLLKVKTMVDAEFTVVDVKEGRGTHAGMAILVCETDEGHPFEVTAPGTHEEKRKAWANRPKVVGRRLTVKYFDMTTSAERVPRFPVALRFRDDE